MQSRKEPIDDLLLIEVQSVTIEIPVFAALETCAFALIEHGLNQPLHASHQVNCDQYELAMFGWREGLVSQGQSVHLDFLSADEKADVGSKAPGGK